MNNTSFQMEMLTIQTDSRCDALRSELEATRTAFHLLLNTIAASGWDQKSPSSNWTLGQVLVHLTWALEYLPEEVEKARHGRGMFNMPKRLADTLSYWYIRWIARTSTPISIGRRYDRAMDDVIALLVSIPDGDWKLGANFYGEGFHSVDDLFHIPARHFAEHTAGL